MISVNKQHSHTRYSGIELLKIIAMFLVVLCHSLPLYKYGGTGVALLGYLDLSKATTDIQQLTLTVFSYLGQLGNSIFIICSVFFLLESHTVNLYKVLYYVIDTLVISILFLLVFLSCNVKLTAQQIFHALTPTISLYYWFVTCYILLYIIHPYINQIIESMNQIQLLKASLTLFIIYGCISTLLNRGFFYSEIIGFITYYFVVAYIKKYMKTFMDNKKINCIVFSASLILFLGMILFINFIGLKNIMFSSMLRRFETFMNPCIVFMGISLFNLFYQNTSVNKTINTISRTSLLVFVIGNNQLVCAYVKPLVFQHFYNTGSYDMIISICLVIAAVTFLASISISLIYQKSLQKVFYRFIDYIYIYLELFSNRLINFIIKITE